MTFSEITSAYLGGRELSKTFKGGDPRKIYQSVLGEMASDKRTALRFCMVIIGLTFILAAVLIIINYDNNQVVFGLLFGEMPIIYFLVNRCLIILKQIENCQITIIISEKVKNEEEFKALLELLKRRFDS